ncbi:hypothetical protein V1509DRAFT_642479 [Lipomyces kononenkoae]
MAQNRVCFIEKDPRNQGMSLLAHEKLREHVSEHSRVKAFNRYHDNIRLKKTRRVNVRGPLGNAQAKFPTPLQ